MIIKYYHGYINLDELVNCCKTTKMGTNAYNLIEASKQIGFDSYGVKTDLDNISDNNLILPCIAHVTLENKYNHYVVIYKINYKKKYLIIADPLDKIIKISFDDFNKIWNKVLIILYPIKKIPIIKDISLTNFMINSLNTYKKEIFYLLLSSILLILFSVVSSFYFKFMIDSNKSKSLITLIFILFTIINLLKVISNYFRNKIIFILNEKIELELITNSYQKIINLPYHYFKEHTVGDIISRINDLNKIRDFINKVLLTLFMDIPLTVTAFFVLFFINHILFYIIFITLILYIVLLLLFKKRFKYYINTNHKYNSDTTSFLFESINGFETVKGLNLSKKTGKIFEQKYVKLLENIYKFNNIYNNQDLIKNITSFISHNLIIFIGLLYIINNKLSLGNLIVFNTISMYFIDPILNTLDLSNNILESKNSIKRILNIMKENEDNGFINKEITAINIKKLDFNINEVKILKDININIHNKEKIMIIGKSGSGKSTLFKILMKYYNIERNQILFNGIDINDYKKEAIYDNISYISQNETLFTDTLLNNLKITNNSNILEISKLCYVDEIIKNNNLGYNMLIEENGFNLSGGEKQRIILNRALLKPFNILLIDEGLNQIDIDLERKILKNIFSYFKDKTIIIISHRLENSDLYDKVINLNEGCIKNG